MNVTTRRVGIRTEMQTVEVLVRYDMARRKPLRLLLVELKLRLHKLTVSCQCHFNVIVTVVVNVVINVVVDDVVFLFFCLLSYGRKEF